MINREGLPVARPAPSDTESRNKRKCEPNMARHQNCETLPDLLGLGHCSTVATAIASGKTIGKLAVPTSTRFPGMTAPKSHFERPDPDSIPNAVVNRLSLYLRELQHLLNDGNETISSSQLGQRLGFTDAQVRKDLAHFGHFGHPGIGYRCQELVQEIRRILGTDRQWRVALVGVGNLGRALLGYRGFGKQGFRIVAAFDVDPEEVGRSIEGVEVHHLDRLAELLKQEDIELGMVAVPAPHAQGVADKMVAAGVSGIVNFAPVTLTVPEGVSKVGVDLARELEQVTFEVANRTKKQAN